MPLGFGIGQIIGLVRETRGLEGSAGRIAIAGPGARELATELAAGGDPSAIAVDGDPLEALVAVRLIEGDPSEGDLAALRRISRAGTPVVVVRRGGGADRIPYVVAGDVVEATGETVSVDAVATAIARVAAKSAPPLAARLPLLRPAVTRRLISTTAVLNAAVAASPAKQAQFPALTLAQGRMLLLLGIARGEVLPRDPQAAGDRLRPVARGPGRGGPRDAGARAAASRSRPSRPGGDRVCGHPRARHRPQSSLTEAASPGSSGRVRPDRVLGSHRH